MLSNAKVVYSITVALLMFGGSSHGVRFLEPKVEKFLRSRILKKFSSWSELVFSILNHPCSLMDYHYLFGAFLSHKTIF